jgi:hypothetical protein
LFSETGEIRDIIAIDGLHFLLAGWNRLIKTTKDRLIKSYESVSWANSLCHITDSIYLVGLMIYDLVVWNEQTDQRLFKISSHMVSSIKRVMNTNHFIIKTMWIAGGGNGVMMLTINDLESKLFSV